MAANPLIPYLVTMALLGSGAALVGALMYRGHRGLGAVIGFAIGVMTAPLISDLIVPADVSSENTVPAARDQS